jgi:hypothetical protein
LREKEIRFICEMKRKCPIFKGEFRGSVRVRDQTCPRINAGFGSPGVLAHISEAVYQVYFSGGQRKIRI